LTDVHLPPPPPLAPVSLLVPPDMPPSLDVVPVVPVALVAPDAPAGVPLLSLGIPST
jgi:hypothetical protein